MGRIDLAKLIRFVGEACLDRFCSDQSAVVVVMSR